MGPAALAELGAHHQAGLATTDNQGVDLLHWHGRSWFRVGNTDARARVGAQAGSSRR
jgi:hypothetical protein